jgi:hypothetical protein
MLYSFCDIARHIAHEINRLTDGSSIEEPKAEAEDKPGKNESAAEDDKGEEQQDDVA